MIKKIVIRSSVLLLVLICSIFLFAKFMNRGSVDAAKDMKNATLPLVYMMNEGTELNTLHGYVNPMQISAMRDTLTPLTDDRILDIKIENFGTRIDDIYFEVLTPDGKTSLENTKVTKYNEENQYVTAAIKLQNLTLMNQEYVLKLQIKSGGKDIYYYTRVLQQDGLHTKSYLDFVTGFYEKCLNKTDLESIAQFIEPSEEGTDDTLASVNIHSTVEQVTWSSLSPQVYYKPIPSIKELNETTASIVLNYIIAAKNEEGKQELFNVSEFYRLKYSDSKVALLDFERTTGELLNAETGIMTDKGMRLGVADRNVNYKSDSGNNFFAFVQENELWSYNVSTNKLAQVFSFRNLENLDYRDNYDKHDTKIIHVTPDGNIYFQICGYMNRGEHEGESGIALYYYEAASGNATEQVFVNSPQSYELLRQDVNALAYVTDDQQEYFFLADGTVYQVNLNTRELTAIKENLEQGSYDGSASGKYFAWLTENKAFDSKEISVMDLDTRQTKEISCGDNERVRMIGFMEEDLVYGIADASEVNTEHEGNELFPMKTVMIRNSEGEVVKEYTPANMVVTNAEISEKLLTLERGKKVGDKYEATTEDHIVNNAGEETSAYGITTQVTERKQTEIILRMGETFSKKTPQIVRSRQAVFEGSRSVEIEAKEPDAARYYIYAKGKLDSSFASVNTAVKRADELLGVVINGKQEYIWERGNRQVEAKLDITKIPSLITSGEMDVAKLEGSLNGQVMDLSGCTLEQVLYFVSEGHPVLVKTSEGVRIMCGYDQFNTILLKPGETESYYYPSDDSKELFEESGNIFVSYMEE